MSRLRVVAYHRIADLDSADWLHPGLISATPNEFARQAAHLANHYNVLHMEEVLETIRKKKTLPGKATLITFDDGYFDFKDHAWPILKRHHLPATVFVPTAFPGEPHRLFWWDRLFQSIVYSSQGRAFSLPEGFGDRLKRLKKIQSRIKTMKHHHAMRTVDAICSKRGVSSNGHRSSLTWPELRRLAREGLTVASHTNTHPILTQMPLDTARKEIKRSFEDLDREIGSVLPIFCYPNGSSNKALRKVLRGEGIELAFGLGSGLNDLGHADLLELRRIPVTRRTTPFIFRLRLLRLFSYADHWRHQRQVIHRQLGL